MKFYSLGQLSNSEKSDILDKHRELYNGYRKVHQPVSNPQDLYVQDFANDKEGLVVNNKGEVKAYTNVGINEQTEKSLEEISPEKLVKGKKYKYKTPAFDDTLDYEDEVDFDDRGEKMFKFKGEKAKSHLMGGKHIEDFLSDFEDEMEEGIYDVKDLSPKNKFDYVEQQLEEEPFVAPKIVSDEKLEEKEYDEMTSAFEEELDEITGPSPLYSKVDPAYNFKSDGPMQAKGPYAQNEEENDELDDYEEVDDDELDFNLFMTPKKLKRKTDSDMESVFDRFRKGKGDVEDIDWEDVDEEVKESFLEQRKKINEMFQRFSKYN